MTTAVTEEKVVDWLRKLIVHVLIGDRLKLDVLYLLALDLFDVFEVARFFGLSVSVVRGIRARFGRVIPNWERLVLRFYRPILKCCEGCNVVEKLEGEEYFCRLCGLRFAGRSGVVLHLLARHVDLLDSVVSCVFASIENREDGVAHEIRA